MKILIRVLCALSLVALILKAVPSQAAADPRLDMPTPFEDLFSKAIELGNFKDACAAREWRGGCKPPSVLSTELGYGVLGEFDYSIDVVRVSRDLVPGSLDFNAVVIHEMVHYLQFLTGKLSPANGCEQHAQMELDAYDATAAYYALFGIAKDFSTQRLTYRLMCLEA